jgi:hypothetical protein
VQPVPRLLPLIDDVREQLAVPLALHERLDLDLGDKAAAAVEEGELERLGAHWRSQELVDLKPPKTVFLSPDGA